MNSTLVQEEDKKKFTICLLKPGKQIISYEKFITVPFLSLHTDVMPENIHPNLPREEEHYSPLGIHLW